jgi:hypothetical protein
MLSTCVRKTPMSDAGKSPTPLEALTSSPPLSPASTTQGLMTVISIKTATNKYQEGKKRSFVRYRNAILVKRNVVSMIMVVSG